MAPYPRYVRHRQFDRLRQSRKFLDWLDGQAARLSLTAQVIFEEFLVGQGLTVIQVENLIAGITILVSPTPLVVGDMATVTVTVPTGWTIATITATGATLSGSGLTSPAARTYTAPSGAVTITVTGTDAQEQAVSRSVTVTAQAKLLTLTATVSPSPAEVDDVVTLTFNTAPDSVTALQGGTPLTVSGSGTTWTVTATAVGSIDFTASKSGYTGWTGSVTVESGEAAVITSFAANGRTATWADGTPPTFTPDTAPVAISVMRQGFDNTGTATTISDQLVITKRARQPYPNASVSGGAVVVTGWTASDVVLSDYVYAGDTMVGVTNGSTVTSPKPIATWAMEDLRVVGNSLTLEVVAAHRDARNGEEVAAVKFTVSDGTTTLGQVVSASSILGGTYDKNALIGYKATIDITSLGANITANATVYPHFGDASSVLDGSSQTSRYRLSPRYFAHKPTKARRYAYVVEGHANGTAGVTSTNLATAKATPYSSIANALRYGLAAGGADCDGDAVVIGSDITVASPITCAINVVTERGDLTIMRDPDVPRANARLLNLAGTPNLFPAASRPVRVRIEDMTVVRGTGSVTTGNATRPLEITLVNCNYNLGTATSPFGSNCTGRFIGCTFSGGGANTFNNVGFIRGCDGTLAGDVIPSSCILASTIRGATYISVPYMVAGNQFLAIPSSTTAFYGGGGGGAAAALVQNVIEPVVQNTNVLRISGDSDTVSTTHQVLHHNWIGGNIAASGTTRNNNFYDEHPTTLRTHELMSLVGNVFIGPCANKGDLFRNDASRLGNWAYAHSVGCHYNVEARVLDAFPKDYRGIGHKVCINEATPLAVPVVSDLSVSTGGSGGGDYHPVAGSPVLAMVERRPLKWDLSGAVRSAAECAAGPYELAA